MSRLLRTTAALAVSLLMTGAARAQVAVGVELARDRATWHFDAPSSYDTSELVPHFFEQQYVLDNVWLTVAADYRAGVDWRTSVQATPTRQALATDYDTFFDPGNVVWVAGTTGDARMHSLRVSQEVELGRRGWVAFSGGYRLRLDVADFLDGNRTDTRNGQLVSRSLVTTREHTNAQTHEVFIRATATRALGRQWALRLVGDAAPLSVNRLAIQLPDKYPGQTLVYRTANMMTAGRVELARHGRRWTTSVGAGGARSWNYHADQWVTRNGLSAGVGIGRAW
ncbi:MAG TPA: hypothetical protein VM032_15860 [Vicinamibacterales bacterium]|nr:hypothetical protein [Vicinamibacterales bacterium]